MRGFTRRSVLPLALGAPVAAVSIAMAALALPTGRAIGMAAGVVVAHVALAGRQPGGEAGSTPATADVDRGRPSGLAVEPGARTPLLSFGLVCLGFAAQALASGLFLTLPSVLVFPIAVYSVTVWGGRLGVVVAAGASVLGAAAATWRLVTDASVTAAELRPSPGLVFPMLLAIALVGLSLGLYRRTQLAYLTVLEDRARRAETERAERARQAVRDERQRIAREMHDIVSHSLAVIVSQAKGGRFHAADSPRAERSLAVIEDTGRQALTDMRGLLGVLRPEGGSDRKPQPGLPELPELLRRARTAGLSITETGDGAERPLTPAAGLAVYRLIQEAVTNVVRHGGQPARATIDFTWETTELRVTVHNDGIATPAEPGSGNGLLGMRERLATVGGLLVAGPDTEGGFTVTARIPYPATSGEEP